MDSNIDPSKLNMLFYNTKREEIQKKLGNSDVANCIFNHLDSLDEKKDEELDVKKIFRHESSLAQSLTSMINTGDDNGVFLGDCKFIIDDEKIIAYIESHEDLKGVKKEDFKAFLNTLINIDEEKIEESFKKQTEERCKKHPDIPPEVVANINDNEKFEKINENGKTYYAITDDEGGYRKLNTKGGLVELKSEALAISESAEMFNTLGSYDELEFFSDEGESIGGIRKYKDGVVEQEDYKNNTLKRKLGKTEALYKDDRLEDISINNGLPNAAKLECNYDENGKIKDFKMTQECEVNIPNSDGLAMKVDLPIKMNNETKELLKNVLNSGAKFGEDFSLEMENNEIKINPIIKNETDHEIPKLPDNIRDEILNNAKSGLRNNRDYTVKYTKDGNFEIDYNTAKGRDYDKEEVKTIYSGDGTMKKTQTLAGDTITTVIENKNSNNKTVNSQSRRDTFLETLLAGDYKNAEKCFGDIRYQGSDFEFYSVCKQYEEITGKNFIDEILKAIDNKKVPQGFIDKLVPEGNPIFIENISPEQKQKLLKNNIRESFEKNMKMYNQINNFDVQKSEVGNQISQSKREKISDNQYTQTTGDNKYTVTKNKDSISVEKNGKTINIDLKNINDNIKDMIFNSDANTLYRIASNGIKLELYSNIGKTGLPNNYINGSFDPSSKTIKLNEETMSINIMKRTLTHETGHSFYTAKTPKNEALEKSFEEELEKFKNNNEQFKMGDHTYCTQNVYEMVAESYTLLTTGQAKSEYTLAQYFPKTFAIIKEMIEKGIA